MKAFNLCAEDIVLCEVDYKVAVDIHHIELKSQLGNDEVDNLIAVCRSCHDKAHFKKKPFIYPEQLKQIINERK